MARKPSAQRAAEQRQRSRQNRDEARARRRPSRDDLARVLLWQALSGVWREDDPERVLERLLRRLLKDLRRQGFDPDESEAVFYELAEKYRKGDPFRRKVHLTAPEEGEGQR